MEEAQIGIDDYFHVYKIIIGADYGTEKAIRDDLGRK